MQDSLIFLWHRFSQVWFVAVCFGAAASAASLDFTLQVGLSLSQPRATDFSNAASVTEKYRLGLTTGLGVDADLTRAFGGQLGMGIETLYTQKGYRLIDDTDVGMNYLLFPFYAWYRWAFLKVLVGGYYAHQIGDITIQTPNSLAANPTNWVTVLNWGSSRFSSTDWGLLFGLTGYFTDRFFLSGRYYWGMQNLLTNPGAGSFKNSSFDILIGMAL